ncbi:MAG: hypothetical protein HY820_06570 [Acidobacteria bacterium]|nr:hypothetical protein [Acidobacteriota bacterium]
MRKNKFLAASIWAALLTPGVLAQPPVAPTREEVGTPRGENKGGYNITNSFELGYRWRTVDGNIGKYRSDVNYGNGVRLLGSQLRIFSREGHGGLFDELTLNTQGLGADPYQNASLRIEKNGLYRYDLSWRSNDYFNPALTVSFGQHFMNTTRRFQDHDFTLFPQSNFKVFLGYTRNSQSGPALTTIQLFDSRGDEYPLFMDINRKRNEYRLGAEGAFAGFRLNVMRGWDNFRESSITSLPGAGTQAGNNLTDTNTLTAFQRSEPYQGDSPYWRIVLSRNARRFGMNARYTNVSGTRDFVFAETATGTARFGASSNRQVGVSGTGRRPVTTASLNLSFLPAEKLTLTSHTSFSNTRMDGNNTYLEVNNTFPNDSIYNFQFLGIKTVQTLADATFAVNKWASLYAGYHYSWREITSREGQSIAGFTDVTRFTQENKLHSGLAGIRLRPLKPLTIQLDAEIGRSDRPFLPIAEKNYHALNARVQYKMKSVLLTALTKTLYNTNSNNLFSYSARSRQYGYDASWTPKSWFSLDAGYSKLHLDTLSGLAYFAAGELVEKNRSLYLSNLHAGNLGVRLSVLKRADLYLGYSIVRDAGDGRPVLSTSTDDTFAPFQRAQTFPLTYQSPQARLSIRLRDRLRWNAGYQFYGYHEDFYTFTYQNYRAHTGYTSLLWSF